MKIGCILTSLEEEEEEEDNAELYKWEIEKTILSNIFLCDLWSELWKYFLEYTQIQPIKPIYSLFAKEQKV